MSAQSPMLPGAKVALLTNGVPPYRTELYRILGERLCNFLVLVSVSVVPDQPWKVSHEGLNVEVQKTITFKRSSKHPHGFRDQIHVHIPYDTLGRLSSLRPDVILSGEVGARTAQALIYRRLHSNSRLIVWATLSEHSEVGRSSFQRFLRRMILPRADAVIVNGRSGARYVRRFGVPDERIFIVPQTTDVRRFSSVSLERGADERHRLIYVGRLIELKGLLQFLSILSIWCEAHPRRSVQFWLVGDGTERARLEKMNFPPNLDVHFWGVVNYSDLPALYTQAGVFVFPTLADVWGLVVNEAMATGLPVLGSVYSEAVAELVEEGVTGWKFRPDKPDEMLSALERALATSPERLRQMGATARSRVERLSPEFGADRFIDAIDFVFREMHRRA